MSVKVKNGVFQVEKLEIENSVVVEYLTGLPDREREAAVVRAIGIGVLAEIKGEIAQFLNETEGELGQRLASLKALYELRELRFRETSGKGEQAERQVLQALTDIQTSLGFEQDARGEAGETPAPSRAAAFLLNRTWETLRERMGSGSFFVSSV